MHVPINVKSPNNISEWQMGFNSAFKGLMKYCSSVRCWFFHRLTFIFTVTKENTLHLIPLVILSVRGGGYELVKTSSIQPCNRKGVVLLRAVNGCIKHN